MKKQSKAERELEDLEVVFRALAHNARRHILVVLLARDGQMTAGEIVKRFSCAWPTTTRHLRQLEDAGLVWTKKEGREQIYILNQDRLSKVVGNWLQYFEKGE